ncbi:DUF2537 domain-containing protein [Gordonia sinesedis]
MSADPRYPATEPTPWALGLIVTCASALFAAFLLIGVYGLIGGIKPWLGVLAVVIVAGGIGWTLWDLRDRPVWRWLVWGALVGFLAGIGSSIALLALGR